MKNRRRKTVPTGLVRRREDKRKLVDSFGQSVKVKGSLLDRIMALHS